MIDLITLLQNDIPFLATAYVFLLVCLFRYHSKSSQKQSPMLLLLLLLLFISLSWPQLVHKVLLTLINVGSPTKPFHSAIF